MPVSLIVLTDFFQAANRALDYATNLAEPLGARLVLLHVHRDSVIDPEMFTGKLSNLSKEAINLAMRSLASNLTVPVVAEVGHGRVASAAVDTASRHQPALIVLGRPDYPSTPDELVHTTSLDILRLAPFPLLVVPHARATTAPPRRVLVAVDGEPFGLGKNAFSARHLLNCLSAEVTVLYVAPDAEAQDLGSAALEAVRQASLVANPTHLRMRTVVHDNPGRGILATAQATEYDLVVLITRPRSFLGRLFHRSITSQVLLHSPLPVLIVPAL
ncbi:universal stress protein [Hymenobacter sp. BT683]|uniref:Universal stress protein n=1 Tax=Hymenobacter jeongseonensis TaxID=2791027 RepID=A0ABS0IHB6_9BACT|nr:universal stress protein [Hymenobacter jeongseonensis]MBF9237751.1 universal stress protein [Hymenobacter jeongseonensis]